MKAEVFEAEPRAEEKLLAVLVEVDFAVCESYAEEG